MSTNEFESPRTTQPVENASALTAIMDRSPSSFAWLVMREGPRRGRLYALKAEGVSLGREVENDLVVDDEAVSRFHARVFAEKELDRLRFYIQDLASANGTFVNGARVARQELHDDDLVLVGETYFVFKQL